MNHYHIHYLNRNGKETPPNMAVNFRVFVNGEFIKDFFPLSAANTWIANERNYELFPLCAVKLDVFEREEFSKNLLTLDTSL
jgi:hypothetical protein